VRRAREPVQQMAREHSPSPAPEGRLSIQGAQARACCLEYRRIGVTVSNKVGVGLVDNETYNGGGRSKTRLWLAGSDSLRRGAASPPPRLAACCAFESAAAAVPSRAQRSSQQLTLRGTGLRPAQPLSAQAGPHPLRG
jgi:hypothetical protein